MLVSIGSKRHIVDLATSVLNKPSHAHWVIFVPFPTAVKRETMISKVLEKPAGHVADKETQFLPNEKIWRFHRRKQPWRKTRHNYEAVQTKLDESKQSGHSKHACNSTKRVLEWRAAIKWTKSFMKRFPLFVYSLWLFSCPPSFHVFAKVNRTNMKRARQWALLF